MVDASIHVVDQGRMTLDYNHMVDGAILNTSSEPNPDLVRKTLPVFGLLVDHPAATILVDTGVHPEAKEGHWPAWLFDSSEHLDAHERTLPRELDALGYDLGDVDAVFLTHLHLDHAGGLYNFVGTDVPIYVHADELAFAWSHASRRDGDPGYVRGDFDHDLNWTPLHRDVETHFQDVTFRKFPGHTPGFTSVQVDLDDHGTVILAGDLAYLDENYRDERPLGAKFMHDRVTWFESLRTMKGLERRHEAEIVYGHDLEQFEAIGEGWV